MTTFIIGKFCIKILYTLYIDLYSMCDSFMSDNNSILRIDINNDTNSLESNYFEIFY